MEKGADYRPVLDDLRTDRPGCSGKIISGSGYAYEGRPAHVKSLAARDFIYSDFCFGDFTDTLDRPFIGESGQTGPAELVEQNGRHIVICHFLRVYL